MCVCVCALCLTLRRRWKFFAFFYFGLNNILRYVLFYLQDYIYFLKRNKCYSNRTFYNLQNGWCPRLYAQLNTYLNLIQIILIIFQL